MTEDLLYLKVTSEVTTTKYGYCMMTNLNSYRTTIRNRFIVAYDIVSMLTDFFEVETLEKCRDVIFNIMSGIVVDTEFISEAFETFYLKDSKFRKMLGEIYYFSDLLNCNSLYESVILTLGAKYYELRDRLLEDTHNYHYKKVAESEGKVYLSVPDERIELRVPADCKKEILSNAKIWQGDCKVI